MSEPIVFVGIPESFRTNKISQDGGGLKFSIELDEQQHGAWEQLSRYHGKMMKFMAEFVGEA